MYVCDCHYNNKHNFFSKQVVFKGRLFRAEFLA